MKNLTRGLMLLSLLVAAPALALEHNTAKAALREAGESLADGNYDAAAQRYMDAAAYSKDPKYIQTAAETYAKGGNHTKAAAAYATYLAKVPNAPASVRDAMEVEKKTPDAKPVAQQPKQAARPTNTMRRPIHLSTSSAK